MPLDTSGLYTNPWETLLSPWTDLLGSGFYLIPVSVMLVALYMKTRDITAVSLMMIVSGALLSTGSIFTGFIEASIIYTIFTAIGIVSLIMSIVFARY